jgi:hypothetical protein
MNPKIQLALALAGTAMAAATLQGGATVIGTPAVIAKTQAQLAGVDVTKDRGTSPVRAGTDAYAPQNWPRLRRTSYRYPRPGWSVAQDRRRAKKARNVARNRRAQRGGK